MSFDSSKPCFLMHYDSRQYSDCIVVTVFGNIKFINKYIFIRPLHNFIRNQLRNEINSIKCKKQRNAGSPSSFARALSASLYKLTV